MISFLLAIAVNPEPWAIGSVGVTNKGGKYRGFVGQNLQLRNYQDAVRTEIKKQLETSEYATWFPVSVPTRVHLYFYRRLDDYKLEGDRKSSRNYADATNMQKAFEDAMQGVLIENDRNNIQVSSAIMEQGPDVTPGTIMVMEWGADLKPECSLHDVVIAAAKAKFAEADKFSFNNEV